MLELVRGEHGLSVDLSPVWRLAPGTRLEPLDDSWAAYSALSGDTMQLNAEAASVIELLAEGPRSTAAVCVALADDSATSVAAVTEALRDVWQQLVAAGAGPRGVTVASLRDTPAAIVRAALRGPGLWLDYGAASLLVHSDSPALAAQIHAVYGAFDFVAGAEWSDLHVRMERPRGLRRWLAPQAVFRSDGRQPFEPFPADAPLPLLEWGCNWLIGRRLNDLLLLHAGAVERDGRVLLLPALPGAGKSTLTAALSLRGWRLLSDEFGAYDPAQAVFRPLLKPVALKNTSIAVIRSWAPEARIGPLFPKTRKGTVAHLGADAAAVARRHEPARPGAVILPRWVEGSAVRLVPMSTDQLFPALAFNAFNYALLGADGFGAAVALARGCPGWALEYSRLDDALAAIDGIWPQVLAAPFPP